MNELPTPRSDAWAVKWTDVKQDTWYVPRIHARTLERELATLQQELAEARQRDEATRQREQGLIKECVEYRGYLYGCDKHRLWQGMSCIGCIEQERDTLRQQLSDTVSQVNYWQAQHERERLSRIEDINKYAAQNDRLREALQNWIKYFQADIPTTADTHEAQAEDFTKYWFTTQEALSQP